MQGAGRVGARIAEAGGGPGWRKVPGWLPGAGGSGAALAAGGEAEDGQGGAEQGQRAGLGDGG